MRRKRECYTYQVLLAHTVCQDSNTCWCFRTHSKITIEEVEDDSPAVGRDRSNYTGFASVEVLDDSRKKLRPRWVAPLAHVQSIDGTKDGTEFE